ncbi:MAG: OmpH family outer membrane protein [Gammaproteobacteria bacterium]|nr:OmpH family outer membrane protein [Gammaproteobacteria bacterium]
MKKILWGLLVALCVVTGVQAKDLKLGVVSVDAIFKNAPQAVVINNKLKDMLDASKIKLQAMGKSIQESQEKLKKDELILSKSQKEEAQKSYIASVKEIRETEARMKNEIEDARNQALAEFRSTVRQIINKIAEEQGYDMIFSEGVAFTKKQFDLTEDVIKQLKSQAEPKKK